MIEINLISETPKARPVKAQKKFIAFSFKKKHLIFIFALPAGIIVLAHIYLLFLLGAQNSQLRRLKQQRELMQPQKKALENFRSGYTLLSDEERLIQGLEKERIAWAPKLNALSLDLAPGVWLNQFSFSGANFQLEGTAVSLKKEEFSLINQFLSNLKNDSLFYGDFENLELESVKARSISGREVTDFTLSGKLRGEDG